MWKLFIAVSAAIFLVADGTCSANSESEYKQLYELPAYSKSTTNGHCRRVNANTDPLFRPFLTGKMKNILDGYTSDFEIVWQGLQDSQQCEYDHGTNSNEKGYDIKMVLVESKCRRSDSDNSDSGPCTTTEMDDHYDCHAILFESDFYFDPAQCIREQNLKSNQPDQRQKGTSLH